MIAAVLALVWRRPVVFVQVALADVVANLLATLMKDGIGRERPSALYPEPKPLIHAPKTGSFPSGHAATSFACATTLTFFLPRWAPAFYVLAAAIAWSRVYNGVHFPLDVLGGAALGVLVAIALRWLVAVLQRSRRATQAG